MQMSKYEIVNAPELCHLLVLARLVSLESRYARAHISCLSYFAIQCGVRSLRGTMVGFLIKAALLHDE